MHAGRQVAAEQRDALIRAETLSDVEKFVEETLSAVDDFKRAARSEIGLDEEDES